MVGYLLQTFAIDIDECNDNSYPHNCSESEHEMCNNTLGSFTCICMQGFKSNEEIKCEGETDKKKISGLKFNSLCCLNRLAQILMNVWTCTAHLTTAAVPDMKFVTIHKVASLVYAMEVLKQNMMNSGDHVRVGH
jgi:hypothetical protein